MDEIEITGTYLSGIAFAKRSLKRKRSWIGASTFEISDGLTYAHQKSTEARELETYESEGRSRTELEGPGFGQKATSAGIRDT